METASIVQGGMKFENIATTLNGNSRVLHSNALNEIIIYVYHFKPDDFEFRFN